jgi:predicted enzyme related to lactoylglutathione lyase
MSNDTTTTPTTTSAATSTSTRVAAPVTWFEVHTADPDRAKRFYGDVFGWTYDDSMPGYSMIVLGDGAPIGGGIAHSGGAYPDHALFNVQVADVEAALDAVRTAGGSVVAEAQTTPYGLVFGYAANPDGSVFGVWCPPPAA